MFFSTFDCYMSWMRLWLFVGETFPSWGEHSACEPASYIKGQHMAGQHTPPVGSSCMSP